MLLHYSQVYILVMYFIVGHDQPSSSVSMKDDSASGSNGGGAGAVIGGVVGGLIAVIVVAIIVTVICWCAYNTNSGIVYRIGIIYIVYSIVYATTFIY